MSKFKSGDKVVAINSSYNIDIYKSYIIECCIYNFCYIRNKRGYVFDVNDFITLAEFRKRKMKIILNEN